VLARIIVSVPFRLSTRKLESEALYAYGLRALERRALTEVELRTRLKMRAADAEDVESVIERLRSIGYVDDERTAESFARSRKEYSSLGKRRVLNDLRRRGIDESTAERIVIDSYSDCDEVELIRTYLRRRLGRRLEAKVADPKETARLYRALQRAGFHSDKIGEVLRRIGADPEWLDGTTE